MGIFVGIGNYIGRVRQIGDGGGQPIGPNDYYIITEDEIAVLTERGKHILLDKYVTEDEIAAWVKEHMVFWYDMSKLVDAYSENFNNWTKHSVNADVVITSTTFTVTRFVAANDVVKCYIPSGTRNFPGMKVTVEGLTDGQEIYWGYSADVKFINITSNGTYDIPPLETVNGNLSFRNGNITGTCNITITQLPSGKSTPTNEILRANPYLQDYSGNNRPLKLFNFLFAGMSGVGGYEINWADTSMWANFLGSRFEGKIESSKLTITSVLASSGIMETKVPSHTIKYKVRITGIGNEKVAYDYTDAKGVSQRMNITQDGEYELPSNDVVEANFNMRWKIVADTYPHTCNITIEQIPVHPNALVTDGVDDYGQVQNFKSLQNYMMFYQCAVIKPTGTAKGMFSTVSGSNNNKGWLLLQNQGKNTSRFGNGTYMNVQLPNDSEVKTDYILTGNGNKMTLYVGDETQILNGTYTSTGNTMGFFLSDYKSFARYGSLAFYKSILFDAVPAKETDGFTEQDLIDYVLENLITK